MVRCSTRRPRWKCSVLPVPRPAKALPRISKNASRYFPRIARFDAGVSRAGMRLVLVLADTTSINHSTNADCEGECSNDKAQKRKIVAHWQLSLSTQPKDWAQRIQQS